MNIVPLRRLSVWAVALTALSVAFGASSSAEAKPQPPVTVTANLEGEVPSDKNVELVLRVQPQRAWRNLTTSVRGLDGVLVEGKTRQHTEQGAATQTVDHAIVVRVPRGVAGWVVVDVSVVVNGKRWAFSRPFPVRAPGAKPSLASPGRLERDADGNVLRVMEAKP